MYFREDTIDDLMRSVYDALLERGKSNCATKGSTTELLGCNLVLNNPRARISRSESRGKIFSCLGELLWYLSGTGDVSFIKHYISKYEKCAEDNGVINGAYGPRIFHMHDKHDQLKNILELLKERSTTRRAVIQLFDASDIQVNYKDVPCTLTLQFTVRENRLDLYTMMRSNDAYLGLPHDIFCFTMLQEIVASSLGCDLGKYHHFVVSLHLYDKHIEKVKNMQNEGYMATHDLMEPMPEENFISIRNTILECENKIRTLQDIDLDNVQLEDYWKDILRLLQIYTALDNKDLRTAITTARKLNNTQYSIFTDSRIKDFTSGQRQDIKTDRVKPLPI
ncbi:thymidylate synthase [Vibrio astriarenae]|uniref:thymidylate synthase n=1 Tax=Vibrio astriarenae TaxID=1481923 RepID=A0A7Z2T4Q0_9VIBR|nr:thymidylate synthase [Vibrio astriarenae]QIA64266.1 thymidylate synthase [Vibrio astriarenae]